MSDVREIGPRIDLKKRAARKVRLRRSLAAMVVLVIAAILCWLVFFSSVLVTKRVEVSGNSLLSNDQVIQAAKVELGVPVARQPLTKIAHRVSELAPAQSVKAGYGWPNSVHIEVTERTPMFQLLKDEKWYWVDSSGVAFYMSSEPREDLAKAMAENPDHAQLADLAETLGSLPKEILDQVAVVNAVSPERIVLELSDGRTVNWGSADKSDEKAKVLGPLLMQQGTNYDVSAPSNPAVS